MCHPIIIGLTTTITKDILRLLYLFLLILLHPSAWAQKLNWNGEIEYDSLPIALCHPDEVWILNIWDTTLTRLPPEVSNLRKLKSLLLNCPHLDLAAAFSILSNLDSLKELTIWESGVSIIPENISTLKRLEDLSFYGNRISEFPESIKKLKKLKGLDFFNNDLTHLPISKGDFPNLIYINLCYNNFQVFPIELTYLPELKRVIMWYTPIEVIPKEIKNFKKTNGAKS